MGVDAAFWIKVVLAALATWRLTHLLAREDGPADLIARLRARLGSSSLGHLMDCFNCVSLWVAAPLAWWLASTLGDGIVVWLALSGVACLLERVSGEKVVIQPFNPGAQGETDGMLRTESGGVRPVAGHAFDRVAIERAGTGIISDRPFATDSDVVAGHGG